jgi:hypothetical protein
VGPARKAKDRCFFGGTEKSRCFDFRGNRNPKGGGAEAVVRRAASAQGYFLARRARERQRRKGMAEGIAADRREAGDGLAGRAGVT